MNLMIEFCVSNLVYGFQEVWVILEKDLNLDVFEYGCLSYCGICMELFFVFVNGEVVMGEMFVEFVENIYIFIEENLMF